jgi:hypothetical protein
MENLIIVIKYDPTETNQQNIKETIENMEGIRYVN